MNASSEAVVVIEQVSAIKTRVANVRRILESERWDAHQIFGIRAVSWSPNGSHNAFDIRDGMENPLRRGSFPDEVLMENKIARTYHRIADFHQRGLSEGVLDASM